MLYFCCVLFSRLSFVFANDSTPELEDVFVHTIEIDGSDFVDSVTGERFLIRGIDYQPGGSASYTKNTDPLSDADVCARDVYLFQELGINTLRVYTINPHLDHDACMTMLAAANIYLVLDVNSPLVGESINRYEPWTTYTPDYLRHVFEVVDQFSRYNNTLGFFIGNEIINDERSAAVSPPYVKAVTRDVKNYMYFNCHRSVPLGYSAADDLRYRKSLSHYLTCGLQDTAVDFYGVNSYQWCGKQTLRTSGYDTLIKDHADFKVPVLFSEFGCNLVKPRLFQEVAAIYSPAMTSTFSGGLVYEYTQEENDYGLVDIDALGNAILRDDFDTLQRQFKDALDADTRGTPALSTSSESANGDARGTTAANTQLSSFISGVDVFATSEPTSALSGNDPSPAPYDNTSLPVTVDIEVFAEMNAKRSSRSARKISGKDQTKPCLSSYPNLSGARLNIPDSFGTDMIRNGIRVRRGKYLSAILADPPATKYNITRTDGQTISGARMRVVNDFRTTSGEIVSGGHAGISTDIGDPETDAAKSVEGRKTKHSESNAALLSGTLSRPHMLVCYIAIGLAIIL